MESRPLRSSISYLNLAPEKLLAVCGGNHKPVATGPVGGEWLGSPGRWSGAVDIW